MKALNHYTSLAEMFRYPSENLREFTGTWVRIISGYDPILIQKLEPFMLHLHKPLSFQQEYYISTFEVQPLCTLDIGYILFGDDYRRGEFLVNMKKEQIKAGNDCGSELPDHLPNILRLIPLLKDPDLALELVYSLITPALNEMISKFRIGNNIYKGLLEILVNIMDADFQSSGLEKFSFRNQGKNTVPG